MPESRARLIRKARRNVAADVPAAGRYYLVVEGSATDGATSLPSLSCAWAAPGAETPALIAGPAGAGILVVQFPTAY